MDLAKVVSVVPFAVRMKTSAAGSSTVVQMVDATLPAVAVGDDVLVGLFDRRLVVLHKIVAV